MLKKMIVLLAFVIVLAACSADESGYPVELSPADPTSDSAVNPVEEPVTAPDVTTVAPSGSVDLGELTPDAASEGDGDLIEQPMPGMPDSELRLAQLASEALAERLGIDVNEIKLVELLAQDWPDSGLGCPSPDMFYAAVITPGYQITLAAGGESYVYHTDSTDTVILCVDGQPASE